MKRHGMDVSTNSITNSIANRSDACAALSSKIWAHPELMYQEHRAHQLLTDFLEKEQFDVYRGYAGVSTAFRAEFQSSRFMNGAPGTHATVAILCEYDALPEIGHACGHNLIAEAGIAAACALKDVLEGSCDGTEGKVVVLGTPAEEGGGGKIDLINAGAFRDVDFAMMVHPFSHDVLHCITLGVERCEVEFHGKSAHASCGPWEGTNALDAAISAYNNVSHLRQHMKSDWRVHAILVEGGKTANIIPDHSVSQYFLRCQNVEDLPILKKQVTSCFEAAAEATGCGMNINWDPKPYLPLRSNRAMADTFGAFALREGLEYGPDPGLHGSSDIGNVSYVVPTIHPRFFAGEQILIHTKPFLKLAGSSAAQFYCLRAAKIMALTAVELLRNAELRRKALLEFQRLKA